MRDWSQQQSPSEVLAVLSDLVLRPAALLSAMLRASLFLVGILRQGLLHPRRWPRPSSAPWVASDGRTPFQKSHLVVICQWCHP
jgi:hypothetical protein